MSLPNAITNEIEGSEFRFHANLAAGVNAFKELVREHDGFRQLLDHVATTSGQLDVFERIASLLAIDSDNRYRNPFDTALAAYLLALDGVMSKYTQDAATLLLSMDRLWWAASLANEVSQVASQVQFQATSVSENLESQDQSLAKSQSESRIIFLVNHKPFRAFYADISVRSTTAARLMNTTHRVGTKEADWKNRNSTGMIGQPVRSN